MDHPSSKTPLPRPKIIKIKPKQTNNQVPFDNIPPQFRDFFKNFPPGFPFGPQQQPPSRPDMDGPVGDIDEVIKNLNLQPNSMPDLDNISLMSGDSDRNSTKGITLNL